MGRWIPLVVLGVALAVAPPTASAVRYLPGWSPFERAADAYAATLSADVGAAGYRLSCEQTSPRRAVCTAAFYQAAGVDWTAEGVSDAPGLEVRIVVQRRDGRVYARSNLPDRSGR